MDKTLWVENDMNRCFCISSLMIIAIAWAGILTSGCRSVEKLPGTGAAHDELVYARYDRKVVPGKIKYSGFAMKHAEMSRPATMEDVANGRAVFSFEGLGKRRVWKLPQCPIAADWIGLKQFPFEVTKGEDDYYDNGMIVQAEELLVGGKWKRYFGFVCEGGVAVVPADVIDLSLPFDMQPSETWSGMNLPDGSEWFCSGLCEIRDGSRVYRYITVGKPLFVNVFIRNRRGVPVKMKTDFYRDGASGGPALVKGLSVSVKFTPYTGHDPDDEDYTSLKPKLKTSFAPTTTVRTVETGKWFKAFSINLSDCFEIKKPGHYRFQFKFDFTAMGLPKKPNWSSETEVATFTIGESPRRLKAEAMNRNIPPFGGRFTEKQLRDLIVKTVKPSQRSARLPAGGAANKTRSLRPASKLPIFIYHIEGGGSTGLFDPSDQSIVDDMFYSIWELIETLDDYEPVGLLKELERRLTATEDREEKCVLASLAASRGSKDAALFLLDGMKTTDYDDARDTQIALRLTLRELKEDQPDWIVQLVLSALSDQRYVADNDYGSSELLTISYLADGYADLVRELGRVKCRKAVPFLIQMCKDTKDANNAVEALGDIGDRSAIPALMKVLKEGSVNTDYVITALGRLKSKEAVPILIKRFGQCKAAGNSGESDAGSILRALSAIGDKRAVEPIEEYLKGESPRCSSLARRVLVRLKSPDPVGGLLELLKTETDESEQESIVWALSDYRDERVVETLSVLARTSGSASMRRGAIYGLKNTGDRGSLLTLASLLDTKFPKDLKSKGWKGVPDFRQYFPEIIARGLKECTKQDFGKDRAKWEAWIRKHVKQNE